MDEDKIKATIAEYREGNINGGEMQGMLHEAGVPSYLADFVGSMHGRRMDMLDAKRAHRKLVRDKIPGLMKAEGIDVETFECTTDSMYWAALASKLLEEALELRQHDGVGYGDVDGFKESEEDVAQAIEELADVSEVLMALWIECDRRFPGKLESIGTAKREAKGTFTRIGIFNRTAPEFETRIED